ncbi:hypothetical protein EON81_03915 [bacterium]|nr:MAG: hypothetical protein EON81_03915 [bacterium]
MRSRGSLRPVHDHALVGSWTIESNPGYLYVFTPRNHYVVLEKGRLVFEGQWDGKGNDIRLIEADMDGNDGEVILEIVGGAPSSGRLNLRGSFMSHRDPVLHKLRPLTLEESGPDSA